MIRGILKYFEFFDNRFLSLRITSAANIVSLVRNYHGKAVTVNQQNESLTLLIWKQKKKNLPFINLLPINHHNLQQENIKNILNIVLFHEVRRNFLISE